MKISVIIPVYNAEKYLGVCLESLLIQTLQDFEVIIVDDCSTDASPAIAESYLEKFGGRLKIIYLEKNTGSGAVPRNEGLRFSRGEYVFFMDADDLIIDNALERRKISSGRCLHGARFSLWLGANSIGTCGNILESARIYCP